jgi:hypothetical protein
MNSHLTTALVQARQDDLRRAAEAARMSGTTPPRHVHINLSFSWLRRRSATQAARVAPAPRTA